MTMKITYILITILPILLLVTCQSSKEERQAEFNSPNTPSIIYIKNNYPEVKHRIPLSQIADTILNLIINVPKIYIRLGILIIQYFYMI